MSKLIHIAFTLLAAVLLHAAPAQATRVSPDPTGIYYDPAAPGYGMSITMQGDLLFVVLFVHDAQGNPTWFVAPALADLNMEFDPVPGSMYRGDLYRATGSPFTVPFDPAVARATKVGSLDMLFLSTSEPRRIWISYVVDSVPVNRSLSRQTFASDAPRLAGTWRSTIAFNQAGVVFPGCGGVAATDVAGGLTISVTGTQATVSFDNLITGTACTATGTITQRGRFMAFDGTGATCGTGNSLGATRLSLYDLRVEGKALTGFVTLARGDLCSFQGTLAAAIKPS